MSPYRTPPRSRLGPRWRDHVPAVLALALCSLQAASCTAAQLRAVAPALTRLGCELVAVLAHDEQVGTLCGDIAPAVEEEIQRRVALDNPAASPLLAHRHRRHRRPVRVVEALPAPLAKLRDPGDAETIEPEYLGAVEVVLARRAQGDGR